MTDRMASCRLLVAAWIVATLCSLTPASAQPCHRFEPVDVRTIPAVCGSTYTSARITDGNDSWTLVGSYACLGISHAFAWTTDEFIEIPTPPDSAASGINEAGVVSGWSVYHPEYGTVGWWWDGEVVHYVLPQPPLLDTYFTGIGEDGRLIGMGYVESVGSRVAIVYDPRSDTFDVFGLSISSTDRSEATTIAADGTIHGTVYDPVVGGKAFRYHPDEGGIVLSACESAASPDAATLWSYDEASGVAGGHCRDWPAIRPVLWRDDEPEQLRVLPGATEGQVLHVQSGEVQFGRIEIGTLYQAPALLPSAWFHGEPYLMKPLVKDWNGYVGGISVRAVGDDWIAGSSTWWGFGAATAIAVPTPAELGDMNCDGLVDFDDLLRVIANWGPCAAAGCHYDIDGDGTVDNVEVLNVLFHWTP